MKKRKKGENCRNMKDARCYKEKVITILFGFCLVFFFFGFWLCLEFCAQKEQRKERKNVPILPFFLDRLAGSEHAHNGAKASHLDDLQNQKGEL